MHEIIPIKRLKFENSQKLIGNQVVLSIFIPFNVSLICSANLSHGPYRKSLFSHRNLDFSLDTNKLGHINHFVF